MSSLRAKKLFLGKIWRGLYTIVKYLIVFFRKKVAFWREKAILLHSMVCKKQKVLLKEAETVTAYYMALKLKPCKEKTFWKENHESETASSQNTRYMLNIKTHNAVGTGNLFEPKQLKPHFAIGKTFVSGNDVSFTLSKLERYRWCSLRTLFWCSDNRFMKINSWKGGFPECNMEKNVVVNKLKPIFSSLNNQIF